MKTLYIDCQNGVCSDMLLSGFKEMGFGPSEENVHELEHLCGCHHHHGEEHGGCCDGDHHHHHHHSASYTEICGIIDAAKISDGAKKIAKNIYETIAKAEAKVHGESLETVHFHEVGRPRAIVNIISIAMAVEEMEADDIVCTDIHDGKGTVECSHGTIPVPVPAVMAIRESEKAKKLRHVYVSENIDMELVTPSGLGILVGIGARHGYYPEDDLVITSGVGHGTRNTGKGGMNITLLEDGEF